MSERPAPLMPGTYWVDLPCPRCGAIETVAAALTAVLTVPGDDHASLKLRVKTKPTDHDCGQGRIFSTADLLPLAEDTG